MDKAAQERRAAAFEQELQEALNAIYPSRKAALDKAVEIESYFEGEIHVQSHPGRTACTICDTGNVKPEPSIDFDEDGRYNEDSLDFHGDSPDDCRLVPSMNAVGWERLQPVKDFLEGKAYGVDVASAYVEGWVADDDEDAEAIEDTDLWVLMAWKEMR
jgi:hypothetical protein